MFLPKLVPFVSSDRSAHVLIPLPPIRTSGVDNQRSLDFRIRLVPLGEQADEQ